MFASLDGTIDVQPNEASLEHEMEAAGIEPASADAPVRASTGLAHAWCFARTAGAWAALPPG